MKIVNAEPVTSIEHTIEQKRMDTEDSRRQNIQGHGSEKHEKEKVLIIITCYLGKIIGRIEARSTG